MTSLLTGAMLSLGVIPQVRAQVTYFERPPTAQELRRALTGESGAGPGAPVRGSNAGQDRPPGVYTRGVVLGTERTPDGTPAPVVRDADQSSTSKRQASQAVPASGPQQPLRQAAVDKAISGSKPAGFGASMPIAFANGSYQVDSRSTGYIATVADLLAEDPQLQIVIEGHTNASGRYEDNMLLSWERAMGVYRMLVLKYGIDPARMQLQGKGPMEPIPGTSPLDASNRRVQFRVARG